MLILVPSPLSQGTPKCSVLQNDLPLVYSCKIWIVENAKPARAALSHLQMPTPIRELEILELKGLELPQLDRIISQSSENSPLGLMSDAGCPGVADPGALAVERAHLLGKRVLPLVGPSSIVLGLMASGLNGQNFHFWGYPPLKEPERTQWIKAREVESRSNNQTQLVIETPFRNQKLLESLLHHLSKGTRLCVATDLTGENMQITTKSISDWQKEPVALDKQPTLFLWHA